MIVSVKYATVFLHLLLHVQTSIAAQGILQNGTMDVWWVERSFQTNGLGSIWRLEGTTAATKADDKEFDNWFITRTIPQKNAQFLYVELNGKITRCLDQTKCFLQVLFYKGEGEPVIPKDSKDVTRQYLLNNFISVYSFTRKTTKQMFKFHRKGTDVTFSIRATGVVGVLHQMKLYYYYCKGHVKNGLQLVDTISPGNGSKELEFNCAQHSSPGSNTTTLKASCESNGVWTIDDTAKCLCNKGFEALPHIGCKACAEDYYQPQSSNSPCIKCPQHNTNDESKTRCRCNPNRYRRPSKKDKIAAPCYALPSKVEHLTGKEKAKAIILTWSEPVEHEGDWRQSLKYDIECYQCTARRPGNCTSLCPEASFSPSKLNLMGTTVTISGLGSGRIYGFKVFSKNEINQAVNKALWNYEFKIFQVESETQKSFKLTLTHYMAMACVGLTMIFVVFVVLVCVKRIRRKRRKSQMDCNDSGISLPDLGQKLYIDPSNYDNPEYALHNFTNEIDPASLSLERIIGGGEFGDVYKGNLTLVTGDVILVAAKTLKKNCDMKSQRDFFLEASAMGQFDDPNVIHLEGIITKVEPKMIVIEFMSNGSLDNFLKKNDGQLTNLQMMGMARGVASGMNYLATIGFVHRDLAARNILVTDTMVCKVADFGLSRELETTDSSMGEYFTTGGKIPVRWTAPEAIKFRKFSSASDVWSFGVLLWEIMTFSQRPYWNWDNFQVMTRVDEGFRLPPPLRCPTVVHQLMVKCWQSNRSDRPTFANIVEVIDEWIRCPETIDEANINQDRSPEPEIDYSTSIQDWLEDIKLSTYLPHFAQAGYEELSELAGLLDNDLKEMGITLVGHRNKILRTVRALPVTNEHSVKV